MGADAANQAIKAIIQAGMFLARDCGIDLATKPHWETVSVESRNKPGEKEKQSALAFRLVDLNRRGSF